MALEPGQTLAHYSLREKIGRGGMGDVFRATDTKLGRDVAIKSLPEEVSSDPDRLARFRREAQILASLNHPNIAAIYGLEEVGDTPFLVLELVEGEDLAARLGRGPVPVEEALGIAQQIAEGLEEAHEHGIIHRDLKPANIKATGAGKVKILDFGLGKAVEASPDGDPSLSPTLTAAATRAGVIMGTAAYMSPEQARGAVVDKRADIWAFGCVLLEMLSGSRTFRGDTISDTLAAVLKSEPDWSALPPGAHPSLRRLLLRCLDKDPRRRLRDVGEARLTLEAIRTGTAGEAPEAAAAASPAAGRRWGLVLAGAVALTAAVTAGSLLLLRPSPPEPAVQKYEFQWPGLFLDEARGPVLSPDGRRIAFTTPAGLWVRELDDLDPRLLAGTQDASHPAWSPDGASLAYSRDGGIWAVPAQGGQAAAVAVDQGDISDSGAISWSEDGEILFAAGDDGVLAVPSRGGEIRSAAEADQEEVQDIHHPHALPGGRGFLYVAHRMQHTYDSVLLRSGDSSRIIFQLDDQEIRRPVYAVTGHILYRRQTGNPGLWAVPFSLERLEVTGEPFLVARDGSLPSAAADGSLLYAANAGTLWRQLTWYDRPGNETGTIGPLLQRLQSPALSPDGRRVAVMAQDGDARDIWVLDVERGTRTRLTFSPEPDWDPAWSPDGGKVLFWDGRTRAISMIAADGAGSVERLVTEDLPDSGLPELSADGGTLLFWARTGDTLGDVYVMPMAPDGEPVGFLRSAFDEDNPMFSPDGRYVAYTSMESSRREIYLTRFPGAGGKWQVSVDGGNNPRWDPRGGRLYYLHEKDLMEVELGDGPTPDLGRPRKLFTLDWLDPGTPWNNRFSVAPAGDRFLFAKTMSEESEEAKLILVRNWFREFDD